MANREDYKSEWTGEQIDRTIRYARTGEKSATDTFDYSLLTKNDILNAAGPNQQKTMSQSAITQLISNLQQQIDELKSQVLNLQQNNSQTE